MVHLDGNAAAGTLSEIFTLEATTAIATCAACGATGAVGGVHVYLSDMGTVLRCPACTAVLMRIVHTPGAVRMDMRGVGQLAWPTAG
jgi:hypothetical protein